MPSGWCPPTLANAGIDVDQLLVNLQNIDKEARKGLMTSSGTNITLDQVKSLLAKEFDKFKQSSSASAESSPGISQAKVIYQICNKPNHSASTCFRRYSSYENGNNQGFCGQFGSGFNYLSPGFVPRGQFPGRNRYPYRGGSNTGSYYDNPGFSSDRGYYPRGFSGRRQADFRYSGQYTPAGNVNRGVYHPQRGNYYPPGNEFAGQ